MRRIYLWTSGILAGSLLIIIAVFFYYMGEFLPYYYEWAPRTLALPRDSSPEHLQEHRTPDWTEMRKRAPVIIAHRGDHFGVPENSIQSVERAYRRRHHGVELDVHVSVDRVPILYHAETIRIADQERSPGQLTLSELRDHAGDIHLLEPVLDRYGDKLLFILELKFRPGRDFSWIDTVCHLVESKSLHKRVILSSLNPLVIRHAHKRCPETPVMYEAGMDLPLYFHILKKTYESEYFGINWKLVKSGMIQPLIEQGLFQDYLVSFYTPVTFQDLRQAVHMEPFIIQTDRPGLLRHILNSYSE